MKQLTYKELKEILSNYLGNAEVGEDIAENIAINISRNQDVADEDLINAYHATVDEILDDPNDKFDCFMIDNQIGVVFASPYASHVILRSNLLPLYAVKQGLIEHDGVFPLTLKDPHTLADLYTALCLGVHESGSWGDRTFIHGADYNFSQHDQSRLRKLTNREADPLGLSDAKKQLDELINEA